MDRIYKKFDKVKVAKLLRSYFKTQGEILLAYLFGSVVEGKQNQLSDLDVAILVMQNKLNELDKQPLGYQASVTTDLMALLHINEVDVVILNHATPLLTHEIVKYGEVVFCRDEAMRVEFEIRVRHTFLDTKPLREIQDYYFKERVKRGLVAKAGQNG